MYCMQQSLKAYKLGKINVEQAEVLCLFKRCHSNFFFDMAVANSNEMMSHEELVYKSSNTNGSIPMEDIKGDVARTGTVVSGYTVVTKSMIGAGMSRNVFEC